MRPGRRRLLSYFSDAMTKSPSLPLMPGAFRGLILSLCVFSFFCMLIELGVGLLEFLLIFCISVANFENLESFALEH